MYIFLKNFNEDLSQKILIETNIDIVNLDDVYDSQARKILNQIGIKEIIINNNIKTKQELIQHLGKNWIKIREE